MEEVFEDRDDDIFYTILSFRPVHKLKTKLQAFKYQGTNLNTIY